MNYIDALEKTLGKKQKLILPLQPGDVPYLLIHLI